MGLLDRIRGVPAPMNPEALAAQGYFRGRPRMLTAAATRLRLDDKTAKRIKTQAWQSRVWEMYDAIGFVKYAFNLQADQVARVPFFPALEMPGDEDPISLEAILAGETGDAEIVVPPGLTQPVVDLCDELLSQCRSAVGGVGETRRQMTLNLKTPGEFWLLWEEDLLVPSETLCSVLSTDELIHRGGDRWEVAEMPGARRGRPIDPARSTLARVWRRHPRWKALADSSMRGILNDCEEYLLLAQGNRAIASSRIANSGLLFVSNDISWGGMDETDDGEDPDDEDPFLKQLAEGMMQAIKDPGSAKAVVPLVVRAAGNLEEKIKHIGFERPLHEETMKRFSELVVNMVRGMDVVPETVFGLGEAANFATARIITSDQYTQHVDPTVLVEADAITTAWLQPGLLEAGVNPDLVRRIIVWRDPSTIISHPDMAKNAVDVHKLGELSGDALRRSTGFSDDDAPSDEERKAFQERATRGQGPADGSGGSPNDPNAGDRQLEGSAAPIETTGREVVASVSQARLDTLGRRLGDIDRDLMTRLAVACDDSVERTLRLAGSRLRSRSQGNTAARGLLSGVENLDVGRTLGRGMLAVLGVDLETEITEDSFGDLRTRFDAWVSSAQDRSVGLVLAQSDDQLSDRQREDLAAQQGDDRREGWAILAAFLVGLARGRVFDPAVEPTAGEFDPTLAVPVGGIRRALARAGGATGGDIGPAGGAVIGASGPTGEIGTGQRIRELALSSLAAELVGWTWETGEPTRPFDPHQQLSGTDFDSWTDDVLAADDAGEFPYVEFYYPGDHDYCQCSFSLRLRERP